MNKLTVKIYPDGRVEAKFDAIDPQQCTKWTSRLEKLCAAHAVDLTIKSLPATHLALPAPAKPRPKRPSAQSKGGIRDKG
jgi:hypothetical protein